MCEPAGFGYLLAMAVVEQRIQAPPEQVFAVLADGWSYSDWVVGTAHIRHVDPGWPAPGTAIHHKAGPWPVSLKDRTEVIDSQPPSLLVLRARLWPLGELTVRIELTPVDADATRVTLAEEFRAGPLNWVQTKVNDLLLHGRNREALRRLADLAVRKAAPSRRATPTRKATAP
ncbi:MAG TPA: SRPBCC family protein [Micromonosporaceae bacterium]|nr:SRPBCC family protein [Micromonosporaceae bacterium]